MTDAQRHREPVRYELIPEPEASRTAESTIEAVHRRLRGRYHIVVATSAILAGLIATSAWRMTKPEFESSGLVRVDPIPATTLHDPDTIPMPSMMAAYVAEQAMVLRGRSVLEEASNDPLLRASGWPTGDDGIAMLENAIIVQQNAGQNIISVAVQDTDAQRARVAVDAVLRSYQAQASGPAERDRQARLASLETRRDESIIRISTLESNLLQASGDIGPELIRRLHIERVEELIAIDRRIEELEGQKVFVETGNDPLDINGTNRPRITTNPAVGPNSVHALEQQELEILARMDSLSLRYGPEAPIMRDLQSELETIRIRLNVLRHAGNPNSFDANDVWMPAGAYAGMTQWSGTATDNGGMAGTGGTEAADPPVADRIAGIEGLIARYETRQTELRAEIADLSQRRVMISSVQDRIDDARMRLSELDRRIEIIAASGDSDSTGVIIATWGDLPVKPVRDRRMQLAVAGVIGGLIMGALLVLAFSSVAPRVRYADDLEHLAGAPALAAMLPDMGSGGFRAEARATRGVHQLRSIIELDTVRPDRNVVVVTSCGRGEGRTSVAMALGTALARSGRRTLLIDADMSRSRMSRELGLSDRPGLVEALGVSPEQARVHETGETGLWALPVGLRGGLREEVLSRPRLQWLTDALRDRFDAIVVDTGPVLASAEGPTLAAIGDRTVLVVERGIRTSAVDSALDRLRQVSARVVGLVLNRAPEADFREMEVGSDSGTQRRSTIVETRPSTFSPAGRTNVSGQLSRMVRGRGTPAASTAAPAETQAHAYAGHPPGPSGYGGHDPGPAPHGSHGSHGSHGAHGSRQIFVQPSSHGGTPGNVNPSHHTGRDSE